jgi:hypothetical protein
MIENIEKLHVEAHLRPLGQREPLREVEVTPGEIGSAERVAAEVSELTNLGSVGMGFVGVAGIKARPSTPVFPRMLILD